MVCLVTSLLFFGGCGEMQTSGLPQGRTASSSSSTAALLYVSGMASSHDVYVFTYPGGSLIQTLTGFGGPAGVCSDAAGNVWIVDLLAGTISEYAHGGTTPIATRSDPYAPAGCSIDPTSGDLAVSNEGGGYTGEGSISIYPAAQGPPTNYPIDQYVSLADGIAYDDSGDVFVAASGRQRARSRLVWLKNGADRVRPFGLQPRRRSVAIGWVAGRLAVADIAGTIERYNVRDGRGVGTGRIIKVQCAYAYQFWVGGSTLVCASAFNGYESVGLWKYPKGGKPFEAIDVPSIPKWLTVSVVPSR